MEKPQWVKVDTFGNGIIYAKGQERKIVTPNMKDFHYVVPIVQLIKALPVK